MSTPSDVTLVLQSIGVDSQAASDKLLPLVYDELRRLASIKLAAESPGQTLQPTALVHEAYLRLVDVEHQQRWDSRGHFYSAAAEAMRRILVDNARRKGSLKRGGDYQRVELQSDDAACDLPSDDLVALDEAMSRLEAESPERAEVVKLRYFAGLTLDQAAEALGISRATAARYWTYARAWLYDALSEE